MRPQLATSAIPDVTKHVTEDKVKGTIRYKLVNKGYGPKYVTHRLN